MDLLHAYEPSAALASRISEALVFNMACLVAASVFSRASCRNWVTNWYSLIRVLDSRRAASVPACTSGCDRDAFCFGALRRRCFGYVFGASAGFWGFVCV